MSALMIRLDCYLAPKGSTWSRGWLSHVYGIDSHGTAGRCEFLVTGPDGKRLRLVGRYLFDRIRLKSEGGPRYRFVVPTVRGL